MAHRRRTLLFTCALAFGAALVPATAASARSAQDPGATFGGAGTETTTTIAASTVVSTTEAPDSANQTVVESEQQPDQPLWSENRKVAAVIGGLVFVALALLLLTIRYIRVTKPVATSAEEGLPMLPPTLELNDESVFVVASTDASKPPEPIVATVSEVDAEPVLEPTTSETPIVGPPGADHDAADQDWEPRTGEHERVEIATGTTLARPSLAGRRKALGVD